MAKFILCVHHEAGMPGRLLLESIRDRFPEIEQENHNDMADLHRRLCLPINGKEKEIVIVLVNNNGHLERLIEMKERLDGRQLVLVLHEDCRENLSRCHKLRPRYVSYEKNMYNDLLSVLEKMSVVLGRRR